eukprot:11039-Pelagococcus_subviridis.AAC.1
MRDRREERCGGMRAAGRAVRSARARTGAGGTDRSDSGRFRNQKDICRLLTGPGIFLDHRPLVRCVLYKQYCTFVHVLYNTGTRRYLRRYPAEKNDTHTYKHIKRGEGTRNRRSRIARRRLDSSRDAPLPLPRPRDRLRAFSQNSPAPSRTDGRTPLHSRRSGWHDHSHPPVHELRVVPYKNSSSNAPERGLRAGDERLRAGRDVADDLFAVGGDVLRAYTSECRGGVERRQ